MHERTNSKVVGSVSYRIDARHNNLKAEIPIIKTLETIRYLARDFYL